MWYEAHQTMTRHPKTLKLARLMKVDRRYAVGLLHDLFSWGVDIAGKHGELPGLEAEDIASALDMPGKKGLAAVNALLESGYLERDIHGTYCIHDWYDYAGKLMERRESDKERQAKNRRKKFVPDDGNNADVTRTSRGQSAENDGTSVGNPYATVPNITLPNHSPNLQVLNTHSVPPYGAPAREASPEDGGFHEFWQAYPRRSGDINRAAAVYLCAVDDGATLEQMLSALEWQRRQPAWLEQGGRYIPSPEKWLKNRGWEQPKQKGEEHDGNQGNSGRYSGQNAAGDGGGKSKWAGLLHGDLDEFWEQERSGGNQA